MSIYDQREQPAYRDLGALPSYAENPNILAWWTPQHDKIIAQQIASWQWLWYWRIADAVIMSTPPEIINNWRLKDPLCTQYAWHNIMMNFAAARAERLGLTKSIREPKWKTCPLCDHRYIESSLPVPLAERLGMDGLDFCAPCLRDAVLQNTGDDSMPREYICNYLRDLAALIERVPPQSFGEGMNDLIDLGYDDKLRLLRLLQKKPSLKRVKEVFGSWLNALIQAEVLEGAVRKTARGIQSVAKDGHICFSLGEKTVDEFLFARGISHEKEPRYPECNYRADFKVNNFYVEYFGLVGDPDYDAIIKEKRRISRKFGISLVAIYPQDLVTPKKLEEKLLPMLKESVSAGA